MARAEVPRRFGPGLWVTIRDTGEHVKIETWSDIASSYRARSARNGLLYVTDAEVDEVLAHPEAQLGKCWARCRNTSCGAPLTPNLVVCEKCKAPSCTCGRCACPRPVAARKPATARRKRAPAVARQAG